jgi:hypothetical protein
VQSTVYFEPWTQSYGSPYLVRDDEAGAADAEIVEDPALSKHAGVPDPQPRAAAFVDGVRRGEATLYRLQDDGRTARGVAGTHACGCVIIEPNGPPGFGECRVSRLVIWGSDFAAPLEPVAGGWSWEAQSIASDDPKAPLEELQLRMRNAEGRLAEDLCDAGLFVVADGPLNFALRRDREIVGYVKTHHRALLAPHDHVRVPELRAGERTSLFRLGEDRYSCYLRLTDGPPWAGPWSGIVRLEFPAYCGLSRAAVLADDAAARLPRYAGVPHRDPRAPQNLQPIGALEYRLRHVMGSSGLAERAVRESVASMYRAPVSAEAGGDR